VKPWRARVSRRSVLAGAAGLGAAPGLLMAAGQAHAGAGHRLWYRQPAVRWEEALPLGNGRLGAMVFGRVAQERLQLNEDTLWAGAPYTPDNPEALAALPEVRRLIDTGRFKEASDLASARMMARPLWQMSYGCLGDLLLDFDAAVAPSGYERGLDLGTAIASTSYTAAGTFFTREAFASAPDQVIVLHLTAQRGRFGFDLGYRGPRDAKYTPPDYQGSATEPVAERPVDWELKEPAVPVHPGTAGAADGPGAWLARGRNQSGPDTPPGLRFAMRVKVIGDGLITESNAGVRVRGASRITLLVAGATSYVNYRDVSGDPVALVRERTDAAARQGFDALKLAHMRDYRRLYAGVSLDLGTSAAAAQPTDVRVATAERADDPALAALYFQYARYLLIACSRAGTQPANLQGLWNEGTNPPWGSKYTININTEMNYWPADPAGLSGCVEPLLRLVEDLAVTGARTARTMYGARGWVAHHNTDLWRAAAPIDGPYWGLWPCGGAWLCNTLWNHYDYTRDPAVLARLYPLLTGASEFFLDTLLEDPQGRGLLTSPSISPENQHPHGSSVCAGPAMDRQILRDLFEHTTEAGRMLQRDAELMAQIHRTRERLAPDRVGEGGQLQEWLEDWDAEAPEQQHRHVSHLYAVYPSGQINVRDTPALAQAARVSLNARGDRSTGWATAWRLCLWARLGDGKRAHAILKGLLGPERTYPNLFDAHPPFQIDGNFGGAAGILEMLVQSWGGELLILPALPAAWPSGHVNGVKARGGIELDLAWAGGRATRLTLRGQPRQQLSLRIGSRLLPVQLDSRGRARLHHQALNQDVAS